MRLFKELKESLEQQTATSEILGVIASSPDQYQSRIERIAATAARLCEANDAQIRLVEGEGSRLVASFGTLLPGPEFLPAVVETPGTRAIRERQMVHVHDLPAALSQFPGSKELLRRSGMRTFLSAPMLREGVSIGQLISGEPKSDRSLKIRLSCLKLSLHQAVIAIENVRLFQELEERTRELTRSVGELKALGEVGQAVSSTLDLQTVLSTIVGRAVQLSGTDCGVIYEYDEAAEVFHFRPSTKWKRNWSMPFAQPRCVGEGYTGQAAETRVPVQVAISAEEQEVWLTECARSPSSRLSFSLAVPILLEKTIMGALTVWRNGRNLHPGAGQSSSNVRDPIGVSDPKRPAVSGNRG